MSNLATYPVNTSIEPVLPSRVDAAGFGDYPLPEGRSFEQMQSAAKTQRIFFAIMMGIFAVMSVAINPISLPFSLCSSAGFTYVMIKMIIETFGVANQAPPMNALFSQETLALIPGLTELSEVPCSGFPTMNGPDSQSWKEELIRSARKSIVLSGCYCGGRTFDRTLEIIREQMFLYPELKVHLISSDQMLTDDNKTHLAALGVDFEGRFDCLITSEVFPYVSPTTNSLTFSTNHTKAMVIDYGAYFMLGGSGIVSSWAEQEGLHTPENVEIKPGCMNKLFDSIFKMRAYRDMDFVFRSEINGAGTRLHVEMTKLMERLRYSLSSKIAAPETDWALESPPTSARFDDMLTKVDGMKVACYATGPEQMDNSFLDEMITQVDAAEESILVNNLYFHPPEKLLNAFIRASNRGVHITILTNTNGAASPGLHALYTSRSRKFVSEIYQGKMNNKIELYEYEVESSTLHKKVMIIDRKVTLLGSTNIGQKCLESHDYEINAKVESAAFADQVMVSMETDKAICTRVPDEEAYKTSFCVALASRAQSALGSFL
jgi:hypothetical protein